MATLLAASRNGVLRAVEGGAGWTAERTLDADVRCLAADPTVAGRVWAGTQGDGVHLSEDAGLTWRAAGLPGAIVKSVACSVAAPGTVYAGTKPPAVFRAAGAAGWVELAPFARRRSWFWRQPAERPSTPYVQALALAPADPDILLAGIEAGAVVRSTNGGASWSGHRHGAGRDCHQLAFAGERAVLEASGIGGARQSDDGGRTWRPARHGLHGGYGWSIAVDAGEPTRRYLAAAPTRRAHRADAHAHVYRSLGDGPWRPVLGRTATLPRLATVEGLVFAAAGDLTWESTDHGEHWQPLPISLDPRTALIALD